MDYTSRYQRDEVWHLLHARRRLGEDTLGHLDLAELTPGGDVLNEDMHNLPRIQAGMRSRAYETLVLGDQERRIRHFHDTLSRYLGD